MSQIFLVIRDEGEYSDREWSVEAVYWTKDHALAHACKLAAALFKDNKWDLTWQKFYSPYIIQTWTVDGPCDRDEVVENAAIIQHHPELMPVIEARAHTAAVRTKLLQEAQINAKKLHDRSSLDDKLRNRTISVEQYYEAVDRMSEQDGP